MINGYISMERNNLLCTFDVFMIMMIVITPEVKQLSNVCDETSISQGNSNLES